jgi:hypothetical protein
MADLEHLEELLIGHEHALATIQGNLVELESEPVFAMLQTSTFQGRTHQRTQTALAGIGRVWKLLPTYQQAVRASRDLFESIGTFRQGKLDDFEDSLTDANVEIQEDPVSVLARRLDEPAEQSRLVTLSDLQAEMTSLFAESAIALTELDHVWSTILPSATGALERSDAALALSEQLRVHTDSDVLALGSLRADLATSIATDPLLADGQIDELTTLLIRVERRLKPVVERRDGVSARLQSSTRRIADLRNNVNRGVELYEQTSREFSAEHVVLAAPLNANGIDQLPNGLHPWLETLKASFGNGDWVSASAGLDRWEALCADWETRASQIVGVNQRPIAQRDELRGLLSATRAKALHRGKVEQEGLGDLANAATAELERLPCNLTRAHQLVQEYLHGVRSNASSSQQSSQGII